MLSEVSVCKPQTGKRNKGKDGNLGRTRSFDRVVWTHA